MESLEGTQPMNTPPIKTLSHFFIHLCAALALSGFLWFLLIHAAISIGRVLSKLIP